MALLPHESPESSMPGLGRSLVSCIVKVLLTVREYRLVCRKLRCGLVSWVPFSLGLNPALLILLWCYLPLLLTPHELNFNTSVFSGCVFALGSQRASLCEGTGL